MAGIRVTEVQTTPNPNARKLMLDAPISAAPISFLTPAAGRGHALAEKLFAVPGVSSLLLLGDFVTVNRDPEVPWEQILPRVKRVLAQTSPPAG